MSNICLYCQRHEEQHGDKCIEWGSCTTYVRWIVIDCIIENYRLNDYRTSDFYCILCDVTTNETKSS